MQLSWLIRTRTDVNFLAAQASQVVEKGFDIDKIKFINKAISAVTTQSTISLSNALLKMRSMRIVAISDSSFANNADKTSQLGHLTLLADDHGHCHLLDARSFKSRRVVRAVLGAEL